MLQTSEDCDDGNSDDGDGCDALCQLESGFVNTCGDGVIDPDEECDGSDDECGADGFCNDACTCSAFVCGDDERNGIEECDGDDDRACGLDAACDDDCLCVDFECGNNVLEGDEVCDGIADAACVGGEICLPDCACGAVPSDPILNLLVGDLLGGIDPRLDIDPWDAVYCDDPAALHGFVILLQGWSAAQIETATFLISAIDSTAFEVDAPVGAAGAFAIEVPLCLATVPEGLRIRTTAVDSLGRTSNAVNWDFPTFETPTLVDFDAFEARDPNIHIFRVSGVAVDRNPDLLRLDLSGSAGESIGPVSISLTHEGRRTSTVRRFTL